MENCGGSVGGAFSVGGGGGGFHDYRRPPQPQHSSPEAVDMQQQSEMKLKLPDVNSHTNLTAIHNSTTADDSNECTVREQDRFMPIANVIRIMRKILPPHAKISDDAKETIQECVSEFISFVTGEANDRCQREQRKTITAEDVLWAMHKLGFDDYIEPLTLYLHRYRELDGGERGSVRGEPLVKRGVDPGAAFGVAAYAPPTFHMGHHHQGFWGPPAMGGFMKDPPSAGPSGTAVAGFEPYAQVQRVI